MPPCRRFLYGGRDAGEGLPDGTYISSLDASPVTELIARRPSGLAGRGSFHPHPSGRKRWLIDNRLKTSRAPEEWRRVLPTYSRLAYADGHLLFVLDGTLFAQRFDLDAAQVAGDPTPIVDGVQFTKTTGNTSMSSISTAARPGRATIGDAEPMDPERVVDLGEGASKAALKASPRPQFAEPSDVPS